MIETIYSNDNGEADDGKAQTTFRMPKNIRQIGKSNANKKIYVEDYVMTYIKQLAGSDYSGCSIAVLVGQCIKLDNCRNIFVSGAVEVQNADVAGEILFTNDIWTSIYEDIKKYFVETEIVGWFVGGPGYLLAEEDKILKTHVDNFAGQDKILLTYDNLEKEESILCYENNRLCKQEGYYIYYEKNEEMQAYIIDHKKAESTDANYNDKVSKDIRTVLQNKRPMEEDSKSVTRLVYAAGTLLAVIVLIVGAALLRNYDQMKSMQETLNYLTKSMEMVQADFAETGDHSTELEEQAKVTESAPSDSKNEDAGNLDVEVVPGNVEPVKEDAGQTTDTTKKEDGNSDGTVSDKELADNTAKDSNTDTSKTEETKTEPAKQTDTSKTTQKETNYYVVESGDTLAGISYKLYKTYTKVDTIMKLNGIEDQDKIYEGQKLIVP